MGYRDMLKNLLGLVKFFADKDCENYLVKPGPAAFPIFCNFRVVSTSSAVIVIEPHLSYDVAVVIQWKTSCHKNRMTTRVITLWRVQVTSLTTPVSKMRFLVEIMLTLKAIKSN